MSVWCWCFGDAVSLVYVQCRLRYSPENSGCGDLVRVRCMRVSSANSTGECTLILFADAIKRNFQGFDDEDC